MKPADFIVAIPMLGVVIASFLVVYTGTGHHSVIKMKSEGGEWIYPMDATETMCLSGPLGDTVIALNGGAVRIESSPCMNRTCIAAGAIRSPGQWVACLPNRIMVYIDEGPSHEGTDADNVDAAAW